MTAKKPEKMSAEEIAEAIDRIRGAVRGWGGPFASDVREVLKHIAAQQEEIERLRALASVQNRRGKSAVQEMAGTGSLREENESLRAGREGGEQR